ncbi:MAG: hypothetical protein GQ474_03070 [Sulfurimonas sp.]|nr:hypothetical protein [Sulfurimonas sp.]
MTKVQKTKGQGTKAPHKRRAHKRVLTNPKRIIFIRATIVHEKEYLKLNTISHRETYNKTTLSPCLANVLFEYVGSKASFEAITQHNIKQNINLTVVKVVVIVFGGTASEFLNIAPILIGKITKIVINDKNPSITNLYTSIRDNKEDVIAEVKKIRNDIDEKFKDTKAKLKDYQKHYRKLVEELNNLEKNGTLGVRRAALFITIMNATFGGNYSFKNDISKVSISYDIKKYERFNIIEKIEMFSFYMQQFTITIETEDFGIVMEKYDSKNALFFIDAPYLKQDDIHLVSTAVTYGNPDFPHKRCIDMTRNLEGQFIYHNYRNKAQEAMFENCKNIEMVEYKKPTNNAKSVNGKKKMSVEVIYFSNRVEA